MTSPDLTAKQMAARALGRCYGAMFFSVFGGLWLLLAVYAFGRLNTVTAIALALCAALLLMTAIRLQQHSKAPAEGAYPEAELKRNGRAFAIVNAVTWISVALVMQILPRAGHPELEFPALALLVGLHFFPMPPLYQHRANLVVGGCMAAWAILCPFLFKGDRMIGFVACGAGILLWLGAAWALRTASRLMSRSGDWRAQMNVGVSGRSRKVSARP